MIVMPFGEDVVGRPGYLHGGAIAGLLEFAAFTTLAREIDDEAAAMKPITVTVDYMRGGTDRDTFATATVERLGTRIANVEAFAWQKDRSSPIAGSPDQLPARTRRSVAAELRNPVAVKIDVAEQLSEHHVALHVEADVMLVGHADAAVHLDALLDSELRD